MPLQERVRFLHGAGVLLALACLHADTRERGPAEAAAVGGFANDDDVVADRPRLRGDDAVDHLILPDDAERKGVHEAVLVVGCIEDHVSSDVRDPERIPVARDAAHHLSRDHAGFLRLKVSKSQHIHASDDPRPHADDVADDPSDARGRPLEGHDLARMVVRFMGDHESPALPLGLIGDRDDAAVLPRPQDHVLARRREHLQEAAGGLVAAVLAPLNTPDRRFDDRGIALQKPCDLPRFLDGESDLVPP